MNARAPTIPTLRAVDAYLTDQFRTLYRGISHTDPSKEADVRHLEAFYTKAGIHEYRPGRDAEDYVKEVVSEGFNMVPRIMEKWLTKRQVFNRSSTQIWRPNPTAGMFTHPVGTPAHYLIDSVASTTASTTSTTASVPLDATAPAPPAVAMPPAPQ